MGYNLDDDSWFQYDLPAGNNPVAADVLYANATFGVLTENKPCEHEFVDVGFMHSKFVCKKCNEEKICQNI